MPLTDGRTLYAWASSSEQKNPSDASVESLPPSAREIFEIETRLYLRPITSWYHGSSA